MHFLSLPRKYTGHKELFSGLVFETLYCSIVIEGDRQLSFFHCTDRVISYDAELKRLRKYKHVLNNNIVVARLYLKLTITSYLYWYSWKFLIHLNITLLL